MIDSDIIKPKQNFIASEWPFSLERSLLRSVEFTTQKLFWVASLLHDVFVCEFIMIIWFLFNLKLNSTEKPCLHGQMINNLGQEKYRVSTPSN